MKDIYLDNASTTKPSDAVIKAVTDTLEYNFGNPSSRHTLGFNAEKAVKSARETIAHAMGVSPSEVYFTSCGSESNNTAIFGTLSAMRGKGRVITSQIEHKSVLNPFKELEKQGYEVKYVGCDHNGVINLEELSSLVNSDTRLVSIMSVNNEVGAIQPVNDIYSLVKSKSDALVHIDNVQGFCKIPGKINADLISVSAHKIGGLKGCGALYVKKGIKISPIIFGGGQENNLRSGTENVPGIVSFGTAVKNINIKDNFDKAVSLNREMRKLSIGTILSDESGSPYILAVSFKGLKSEVLLNALAMRGVYVSSGSACASNHPELSHVLIAMGIDRMLIDSTIRISFSPAMDIDDISQARGIIEEEAEKLIRIMKVRR